MSTIHAIGARLCATFFVLLFCSTAFAGSTKVEVCHIPPGDPDNYHTITINEKALAAHLAHFDLVGACDSACAVLCDDGNACTRDDTGDCELNGCPVVAEPVDCDDSNLCTVDSCDPESGCLRISKCEEGDMCNPVIGECVPENSCPCFTLADLQEGGPVAACGDNFSGYPDLAAVVYTDGTMACSGTNCAIGDGSTSCSYKGFNETEPEFSATNDADCRALILDDFCSSPIQAAASTAEQSQSSSPVQAFIDQ